MKVDLLGSLNLGLSVVLAGCVADCHGQGRDLKCVSFKDGCRDFTLNLGESRFLIKVSVFNCVRYLFGNLNCLGYFLFPKETILKILNRSFR